MNRTTIIVLAAFAAAVIGWLSIQDHDSTPVKPVAVTSASADAGAGGAAAPELDPLDPVDFDMDGGVEDLDIMMPDAGFEMPDGGDLPELKDAPKSVHFGVVLIQFKGAQGAKADARSYDEAKALATEIAPLAKEDFEAAVKKGDPGSTTNAGRMFRHILEPAPEAALFSLAEGEVSDPVDTPRGIWIVKRLK
jgi:parvulin-like peptidyl-prolyl isomerase